MKYYLKEPKNYANKLHDFREDLYVTLLLSFSKEVADRPWGQIRRILYWDLGSTQHRDYEALESQLKYK